MNIKYFTGVTTIEELKKAYRQLAKKFHPDLNHDKDTTEIMKIINLEYEFLFANIGTAADNKAGHSVNDGFREIINKLMKYESITIEVVGSWIWLSGETYPVKEQIKELGFRWSKNNKKWYLGEISGKRKASLTWEQKIEKYGLQTIKEGKKVNRKALA